MAINAGAAVSFREFRSLIKNPSFQSAMSDRQRELRDMGIASPTASTPTSVLVPQGFVRDLEVALKYFGGMLEASDYLDTSTGQPLPYPTENDTAISGELISENTQVTAQDLTVSNIIFNAWKYSTKLVKVSLELLQDSAFDLEGVLRDAFAIRLGRILNTHFTNGTGTGQPKGLLVAAPVGPTAVGSSGNTGGTETGGTSIGSDDLIALEHSVDPLYRRQPGAGFMLHDATLAALRKVKDKYGRPLWPQLYDGSAKSINGYPIFINNDMPTIALNATTVAFGALKKYKIRRVKDLAVIRLVERFADYGQVAFIGFARYDGNLLDAGTNPVKLLKQAAA
ncbi:MAG TPA: phage major capsid protein [Terriglobales bacterium]|nr:phage major capsid protein [Terriglobales bacterium]